MSAAQKVEKVYDTESSNEEGNHKSMENVILTLTRWISASSDLAKDAIDDIIRREVCNTIFRGEELTAKSIMKRMKEGGCIV